MKISELQAKLEAIKQKHGDILIKASWYADYDDLLCIKVAENIESGENYCYLSNAYD